MSEQKNAEEIVRALQALRDGVHSNGLLQMAGKQAVLSCAVDLIESQQAQLAESQRREQAAMELIHAEMFKQNRECDSCLCVGCKTDPGNVSMCPNWQWHGPQEAGKGGHSGD